MKYSPREYQNYTTQRILNDAEVGPFLDMGLGKTVSSLTAIEQLKREKKVRKVLVIAPKKVAESVWSDEIEKWDHLAKLKVSKVLGSEKDRRKALATDADIYAINRENVVWLVSLYGSNWPFDMVVIDELSSFKSPKSQRFKALVMVRRYMKRVVGLTGTPAPNGLLDLWSQIFLLDKGKSLGESYAKYRDMYFVPDYNGFKYTIKKGDVILGEDFYEKEILDKIKNVCFSMKTSDYLELPDMLTVDQKIVLPKDIKKKYDDFEEEQVLKLLNEEEITALSAAALTNKIMQFANGAVYDNDKVWHEVHTEKIERLREILDELNGKPLLLFYNFKHDKERILQAFKFARELKKPSDMRDWNRGEIPLLVTHPQSAGHGLNLQFGGTHILWFSTPWGLESYEQGYKRVHRNGVSGIVTNMRLVAKGTIDEDVIAKLALKCSVQEAVMEAVKARIQKYKKQMR